MGWGLARGAYLDAVSDQGFHLWLGSHWGLSPLVCVNGRRPGERAKAAAPNPTRSLRIRYPTIIYIPEVPTQTLLVHLRS